MLGQYNYFWNYDNILYLNPGEKFKKVAGLDKMAAILEVN